MLELSRGVDHKHRDISQSHHFFGHGAEQKPPPAAVPVGGDGVQLEPDSDAGLGDPQPRGQDDACALAKNPQSM